MQELVNSGIAEIGNSVIRESGNPGIQKFVNVWIHKVGDSVIRECGIHNPEAMIQNPVTQKCMIHKSMESGNSWFQKIRNSGIQKFRNSAAFVHTVGLFVFFSIIPDLAFGFELFKYSRVQKPCEFSQTITFTLHSTKSMAGDEWISSAFGRMLVPDNSRRVSRDGLHIAVFLRERRSSIHVTCAGRCFFQRF